MIYMDSLAEKYNKTRTAMHIVPQNILSSVKRYIYFDPK